MNDDVVFFFSIQNVNHVSVGIFQITFVAHLASTFGVEWCQIKHQLIHLAIFFGNNFTVTRQFHIGFQHIVTDELFMSIICQNRPIICRHFARSTRTVFLLFHFSVKTSFVKRQAFFAKNQSRQIYWEAICIIQFKCLFSRNGFRF